MDTSFDRMILLLVSFSYLIRLSMWGDMISEALKNIVTSKKDQSIVNGLFLVLFDDKFFELSFLVFDFELYWFLDALICKKNIGIVTLIFMCYDFYNLGVDMVPWEVNLINIWFNISWFTCHHINIWYFCIHRCVNDFINGDWCNFNNHQICRCWLVIELLLELNLWELFYMIRLH